MVHAASSSTPVLRQRVAALRALFDEVRTVRMQGVPIVNLALHVETIGFEVTAVPDAAGELPGAVGVLITPWCMNLVWFPLQRVDQPQRVGNSQTHAVGTQSFDFIAAHEEGFGSYAACSLFSPMFEFKDQASAVATAEAVLVELRRVPEVVPATTQVAQTATTAVVAPAPAVTSVPAVARAPAPAGISDRRSFLFGRRSPPPGARP